MVNPRVEEQVALNSLHFFVHVYASVTVPWVRVEVVVRARVRAAVAWMSGT